VKVEAWEFLRIDRRCW